MLPPSTAKPNNAVSLMRHLEFLAFHLSIPYMYVGSYGRSSVLALASDLRRLHFSHVIAHSVQLHGGSKQVELMQTSDIAVEGILCSWFQMLVHQGVVDS